MRWIKQSSEWKKINLKNLEIENEGMAILSRSLPKAWERSSANPLMLDAVTLISDYIAMSIFWSIIGAALLFMAATVATHLATLKTNAKRYERKKAEELEPLNDMCSDEIMAINAIREKIRCLR